MKIGLSGIPGAGKTELANALNNYFEQEGKTTIIIDDYVSEIEQETNLALGFSAAYVGNIHVALGRAARERLALEKEADCIITCGTLFETSSYTAQAFENEFSILSMDDDKYNIAQRMEATMRAMACFYIDLVKYDYVFHLAPLNASEDDNLVKLERNLQAAFQAFDLFDHTVLEVEGTTEKDIVNNRITKVLEAINANNTEG
jgi:energy-coupling factor transporter ATP-binding protein EcfA2